MNAAVILVKRLLEARPEEEDPVKDMLLAMDTPENYKRVVLGYLDDPESEYQADFSNEPADRFISDMIRQEKSPAEAAQLWPFWDEQIEEHGDWVIERGDQFNFDPDDFKKDWDENYRGRFEDAASYAQDWHENAGEKIPEHLEPYIDWERYGTDLLRDMETYENGGYTYVFWSG